MLPIWYKLRVAFPIPHWASLVQVTNPFVTKDDIFSSNDLKAKMMREKCEKVDLIFHTFNEIHQTYSAKQ